jgi:hypothetical protein
MTVRWLFLTELCYFFCQFYCFPKIAVTDCIIYSGAKPMYYDSPKLLLPPHFSQWRSVFVWILKRPPGQHMSAKFPTIFSFPGSQHRLKFSSDIAAALLVHWMNCLFLTVHCFSSYCSYLIFKRDKSLLEGPKGMKKNFSVVISMNFACSQISIGFEMRSFETRYQRVLYSDF